MAGCCARGAGARASVCSMPAPPVFARKGFHQARVDYVVAAAHSSHGTFYHCASKQDLFDQLVVEVAAELHALIDELPAIPDTDRGRAGAACLARPRE